MRPTASQHGHQGEPGVSPRSAGPDRLPGIRHLVAVGSGKGGVGKSTVAVNLALALQHGGARVGLVDADVLGPSIPGMLGLPTDHPPGPRPDGRIVPADRHGLKAMSMGLLRGDDDPAILRGPMVSKYLQMFVGGVDWGQLDYLILDLPPGTGDTQLTLAQSLPTVGCGHRHDAPGREPQDRPPRAADVRDGASRHPRHHREHEHLHLSRPRSPLPTRRRPRPSPPWQSASSPTPSPSPGWSPAPPGSFSKQAVCSPPPPQPKATATT